MRYAGYRKKTAANECHRILKPGGHIVAFGSSRTVHRLAVAIEDAGLEVRDSIYWQYYTGFPKSLSIELEGYQGYGTGLKPAVEPAVLARKPLIGTVAANLKAYGTGALNVDSLHKANAFARYDVPRHKIGG